MYYRIEYDLDNGWGDAALMMRVTPSDAWTTIAEGPREAIETRFNELKRRMRP